MHVHLPYHTLCVSVLAKHTCGWLDVVLPGVPHAHKRTHTHTPAGKSELVLFLSDALFPINAFVRFGISAPIATNSILIVP